MSAALNLCGPEVCFIHSSSCEIDASNKGKPQRSLFVTLRSPPLHCGMLSCHLKSKPNLGFDLWQRAHGLMLPGKDGQKENLLVRPMSSRDLAILLISGKMTIL